MTFADKLKELRNGKNMSQEQLAEKLYVSRQAITKWETGAGLLESGGNRHLESGRINQF